MIQRILHNLGIPAILLIMSGAFELQGSEVNLKEWSINLQGKQRSVSYSMPSKPNRNIPLFVVLHSGGSTGRAMMSMTEFSELGEKFGYAAAYPDAYEFRWNDGRNLMQFPAVAENIDDLEFLRRIRDHFVKNLGADPSRIYLVGHTNGGFMTARALCQLKGVFQGYAVVQAGLSEELSLNCNEPDPKPILFIHGANDKVIPLKGGEMKTKAFGREFKLSRVLPFENTMSKFSEKFGCRSESRTKKSGIITTEYTNCDIGARLQSVIWKRGDQSWSREVDGFSTTKEVLRFFGFE